MIAEMVKEARKKADYTQTHLANLMGYGVSTQRRYEDGTSSPSMETLVNIMLVCNQNPVVALYYALSPEQRESLGTITRYALEEEGQNFTMSHGYEYVVLVRKVVSGNHQFLVLRTPENRMDLALAWSQWATEGDWELLHTGDVIDFATVKTHDPQALYDNPKGETIPIKPMTRDIVSLSDIPADRRAPKIGDWYAELSHMATSLPYCDSNEEFVDAAGSILGLLAAISRSRGMSLIQVGRTYLKNITSTRGGEW